VASIHTAVYIMLLLSYTLTLFFLCPSFYTSASGTVAALC